MLVNTMLVTNHQLGGQIDRARLPKDLRRYIEAFAGANYQNPKSITPVHQMLLPRIIKG